MALDGTGYRVLASFPKGDRWLAFDVSRDGRQVVVSLCASNDGPDKDGLYLVDTQSGQTTQLSSEDCYAPSFSPDGKRVAFESAKEGCYQIHVMELAGKRRIRLCDKEDATAYRARWSPDGGKVAFRNSNDDLLVADAAGGRVERVAHMGKDNGSYAFSPQGDRLAYRSGDKVCAVPVVGGQSVTLGKAPLDVNVIEWSSDGKTVIFDQWAATPDGPDEIKSFKAIDVTDGTVRVLKEW